MTCTHHLRQLGIAAHHYHDVYQELPAESYYNGTILTSGNIDEVHASYRVRLLPFIEQTIIRERTQQESDQESDMETLSSLSVPIFFCPSAMKQHVDIPPENTSRYASHYYGIAGAIGNNPSGSPYRTDPLQEDIAPYGVFLGPFANTGTMIIGGKVSLGSITDGTSNTLLFGEISWTDYGAHYNWIRGTAITTPPFPFTALASSKGVAHNFPINAGKNESLKIVWETEEQTYNVPIRGLAAGHGVSGFGSNHTNGAHFAHADGSVRFYSETTDTTLLMHLATRDGGENAVP
jgi:hypothetical protein